MARVLIKIEFIRLRGKDFSEFARLENGISNDRVTDDFNVDFFEQEL